MQQHILKLLREKISKKTDLQTRMDAIVIMIAKHLHVQVCSCYLLRPGDILELYASYGLNKNALHETFLRVGEGLIGEIAFQKKTLIFSDAWAHPSFVHKPETKESKFKSLLGVPIFSNHHQLLGVIAIQTDKIYDFSQNESDFLEHISLIITELLEQHTPLEKKQKIETMRIHKKLDGISLVEGLAKGTAFIHERVKNTLDILSKNPELELKRLNLAFKNMENQIHDLMHNSNIPEADLSIIEAYLKFTQDKGWRQKISAFIEKGFTAEISVSKVLETLKLQMAKIQDTYIREKIHDFEDLSNRLLRNLQGIERKKEQQKMPKDSILIAESLGPSELLDYDVLKIKALVLKNASQTMHVVIIARSLNIPVISISKDLELILQGDQIIVDAKEGSIFINPSEELLDNFSLQIKEEVRLQEQYHSQKDLPSVTTDGVHISLNANIGLASDLILLENRCFDGVGLYRTELPFLTASRLPDIKTQTKIYKSVTQAFKNKPIYFRTLDIGSDKILPYFDNHGEENPALGWRSIRISLDRRSLLREQLRAFIRASQGRELHVMFPMISDIDEFIEAKKTLDIELEREYQISKTLPSNVFVGTMIEVPSLILQLQSLLPLVDFVSIGTNDLMQFLFAIDRGNTAVWNKYDALSPALLKALHYINQMCEKTNTPCSVCGEMASKPLEAMALVGLGFKKLSMTPSALGKVKSVIRTMNQEKTQDYLQRQLNTYTHSLRDKLRIYAIDQGVFI